MLLEYFKYLFYSFDFLFWGMNYFYGMYMKSYLFQILFISVSSCSFFPFLSEYNFSSTYSSLRFPQFVYYDFIFCSKHFLSLTTDNSFSTLLTSSLNSSITEVIDSILFFKIHGLIFGPITYELYSDQITTQSPTFFLIFFIPFFLAIVLYTFVLTVF